MPNALQLGSATLDAKSLAELCARYGVQELSLFGSAVRNQERPDSDIDLLVEFKPETRIGLIRFEALAEELAALTGRKVDLVTKRGLKSWVRPHVLKEARVIYAA